MSLRTAPRRATATRDGSTFENEAAGGHNGTSFEDQAASETLLLLSAANSRSPGNFFPTYTEEDDF